MHTDNPESVHHSIDPATMFAYRTHTNIPWHIQGYHTPALHFDAKAEIQARKEIKKGLKDSKYQTKKGFYMDYDLKQAKEVPSPMVHGEQIKWTQKPSDKNAGKLDPKARRRSYLDSIETEHRVHPSPGVAKYNIEKPMKEVEAALEKIRKKKVQVGDKHYFYEDTEYLSNRSPGAGTYTLLSPIEQKPKEPLNKTDSKFWISKHQSETERDKKRDSVRPAAGTYNPLNVTFDTFERLERQSPKGKQSKSPPKGFGCDARFEYTRPSLRRVKEERPAPTSYQTMVEWHGKTEEKHKRTWNEALWKGLRTMSVYH